MGGARSTALLFLLSATFSIFPRGHGILHLPEGRNFLRTYCNALRYNKVNIFLSTSDPSGTFTAGVLRSLWDGVVRSVSIRRVSDVTQVVEILTGESSSSLNLGFLHSPAAIRLFVEVAGHGSAIRNYKWLVFGDIRKILFGPYNLRLILDNQVTFAHLSNATTHRVDLVEAYNIDYSLRPRIQSLGYWRSGAPISITKRSWFLRRTNLTGLHLKCTTLQQPPFMYLSEPDSQLNVTILGGYAADIWHTLQDTLGFSYSCRSPADGQWGSKKANGDWTGLVKDVLDSKADVVVTSLDRNIYRMEAVDFLSGIKEVGYQMITRRPGLMEQTWTSFTSELVSESWAATIAFALLVPPCLSLCAYFSPVETQRITLKDAYLLTIGAFSSQGSWLEVRSLSTRIVFITIFLTTLMIYAHYTSALVSLLTVAPTRNRISSLQELLDEDSLKFGFKRHISIQEHFQDDNQLGLFHEVWTKLISDASNLPLTNADGVAKVIQGDYVFMMEENIYRTTFSNSCDTTMIPGKYFTRPTGFAFAKGSPLTEIFNAQIMSMREGGALDRFWRSHQPTPTLCTSDSLIALDTKQLFTAFLLLLLGFGLSAVFLPLERLHWNFTMKDRVFKFVSKAI